MRKQLWIGLATAAVCLYFVFRGISFQDLLPTLRQADWRWIVLAMGVYITGFLMRAARWEILIRPIRPIPAAALFGPMVIGFFANNILPFRMGELVRAHLTGKKFHISRTASLGTILLERLGDTLSFLTIFLVVALFFPFPAFVEKGAAVLGTACAAVTTALVLIQKHQRRFQEVVTKTRLPEAWKEKIQDLVNNFAHGVSGMTHLREVVGALCLSVLIWTMEGTFLYLMARAFAVALGYPQSFFLLFFMGLSVALPQAPGYVGTLELFGVAALSLLGIPKEQGLPVILAIHGTQFSFIMILGTLALWKEGLTLRNLTSEKVL